MKVVINKCYGGFGLSDAAYKRIAELKGLTLYPETSGFGLITYWIVSKDKRKGILSDDEFYNASLEARRLSNKLYSEMTISATDIPRNDKELVQTVEELCEDADGRFSKLSIVTIPDDVEWVIDEYDGMESIHEAHRVWE